LLVIGEMYSFPLSSTLPSFGKEWCAGKIIASSRQGVNEYPNSFLPFVSADEVCLTGLTFSVGMGSDVSRLAPSPSCPRKTGCSCTSQLSFIVRILGVNSSIGSALVMIRSLAFVELKTKSAKGSGGSVDSKFVCQWKWSICTCSQQEYLCGVKSLLIE
jgi:hypothetical protein